MQELAKDREMLTSPRKDLKEVEEEMPTGLWKASPMRVGDVSVPVKKKRDFVVWGHGERAGGFFQRTEQQTVRVTL